MRIFIRKASHSAHNRRGQECGHVHTDIENRDRDKEIRDKRIEKEIEEVPNGTSCAEPEKSGSTHSRCFAVKPSEAPLAAQ